jgi:DNA topoisomerase-1
MTKKHCRQIVLSALDDAAEMLGNTRAVCRNYYVHPVLIERYLRGDFPSLCADFKPRRRKWLDRDEQLALCILERLERDPSSLPHAQKRPPRACLVREAKVAS